MRRGAGETWQQVANDPRFFRWFVLLTVALGVFTGALTDLLNKMLGETTPGLTTIVLSSLVVFLVALYFVRARISRSGMPIHLELANTPAPRRGLIALVSQEPPVLQAVEYHRSRLERCWLLCSHDTAALAESLAKQIEGKGLLAEWSVVGSVDSPQATYAAVQRIYGELPALGLDPDEVIADYLGMTAHCSVGMALACLDGGWPLQCTRSVRNPAGELQPLDPVEIRFDFRSDGQNEAPPAPTASLAGTTEVGT